MKTLEDLKTELDLKPGHIMLLANTGSMTALLEALFGPVRVETVSQEMAPASPEISKVMDLSSGEQVNHRVVRLVADRPLVEAVSYARISRLKEGFKADIMNQDMPIGKIMEKHALETRREILGFEWTRAGAAHSKVFEIEPGETLLKRSYNIIIGKRPLIHITEIFPYSLI